jgi:hypothetical protein
MIQLNYIPFVKVNREELDQFGKRKQDRHYLFQPKEKDIYFVHKREFDSNLFTKELKQKLRTLYKDYYTPRVFCSSLGICSPKVEREKSGMSDRFSYGIYWESRDLLLMDDLIEWSDRKRESKDVRSAWDLIKKESSKIQ